MSGVETRSRLEQLEALRRRTQHELAIATARGDHPKAARLRELDQRLVGEIVAAGGQPPTPTWGLRRTRRQKANDRVTRRLEQLGVTAHDVKVWAVSVGLLDQVRRGRIKGEVVEAYANAHHPTGDAA